MSPDEDFSCFTEAYSREQTEIVQKIVAEHKGSDFVFAEDPQAKKELWKVGFHSFCVAHTRCSYLISLESQLTCADT